MQKQPTPAERPTEITGQTVGHEHELEHGGPHGERMELYFAILCGGLLAAGWLLSAFSLFSSWIPWCLYVAAYIFGGYYTFRDVFRVSAADVLKSISGCWLQQPAQPHWESGLKVLYSCFYSAWGTRSNILRWVAPNELSKRSQNLHLKLRWSVARATQKKCWWQSFNQGMSLSSSRMIAMLVPATLFGLQMGPAVVFHEGSTLLVVLNALRLLAYQAD